MNKELKRAAQEEGHQFTKIDGPNQRRRYNGPAWVDVEEMDIWDQQQRSIERIMMDLENPDDQLLEDFDDEMLDDLEDELLHD